MSRLKSFVLPVSDCELEQGFRQGLREEFFLGRAYLSLQSDMRSLRNRSSLAIAVVDGTIHEISEEGGQIFLVMEFIEGESLDNKIERGPLSLKEALSFARQVADGLDTPHTILLT